MTGRLITLSTCALLLTVSGNTFANNVATLNRNIDKCYAETLKKSATASTRACNYVIKHGLSNRHNKAIALHNRGVIYTQAKKLDLALKSFKSAERINSQSLPTLLAIAQIHKALHRYTLARNYVDLALAIDSENYLAKQVEKALRHKTTVAHIAKKKLVHPITD